MQQSGTDSSASSASLLLDGMWRVVFDRENAGVAGKWQNPDRFPFGNGRDLPVPCCWEEHEPDYEGVAWYAREIVPPEAWEECHVRLRFEAANYLAEVWLNGDVVGAEESGFTPVEFDVTQLLRLGETNLLIVRVVGPAVRTDRVDRYLRDETPHWRGAYAGGIWQSVRLLATDPLFVRDIFVEPCLASGSATVNVDVANEAFQPLPRVGEVEPVVLHRGSILPSPIRSRRVDLAIRICPLLSPEKPVASARTQIPIPPGGAGHRTTLQMDRVVPWSPEEPHLYAATVELSENGRPFHAETVRFGMRDFTVNGAECRLNGKRVFLKAAFWEGLYPATLAHPRDPEIVRREIRLAKEAGFNLLRPWRLAPAPMILDLADEMGMMLTGSPAIACMGAWPSETPRLEHAWTRAMTEMVRRDRNHPSVVLWETSNEIMRKAMLIRRHRVSLAARALDPTRLIIDESGGSRAAWGTFAYPPHSHEPVPFDDRHLYLRAPVNQRSYERLQTYGAEDQPVFVSEIGYGSLPDIAANVARYRRDGNPNTPDYRYHHELHDSLEQVMAEHELHEVFPDIRALCRSSQDIQTLGNVQQLEALRINPKASGYCLHAFTDGDWVVGAGVLDIWREPKPLYDALKTVQKPLYLAVRVSPGNVYAKRGASLAVTAANDGPALDGELHVTVADQDGREIWCRSMAVAIPERVTPLLETALPTTGWRGACTATARLLKDGIPQAETQFEFRVFADTDPGVETATVVDAGNALGAFLESHGVRVDAFGSESDCTGPVLVGPSDATDEESFARLMRLLDWVGRGGVAVWLDPPAIDERRGRPVNRDPRDNFMIRFRKGPRQPANQEPNYLIRTGAFPCELRSRMAEGTWIPVGHYARRHPVFDGLPVAGFMNAPWQNTVPRHTLTNLPGKAISGAVSWDVQQDYRAETRCWHGTNLGLLPHGRGTLVLSTLRILPHLGRDPVADILLRNLLAYAASLGGTAAPASGACEAAIPERLAAFRNLQAEWKAEQQAAAAEPWP